MKKLTKDKVFENWEQKDFSMAFMLGVTVFFHNLTPLLVFSQLQCLFFFLPPLIRQLKTEMDRMLFEYIGRAVLFCAFSALSYLWAISTESVIGNLVSVVQVLTVGVLVFLYVDNQKAYERVVWTFCISGLMLCVRLLFSVPLSGWLNSRVGDYIGYGHVLLTYTLSYIVIFIFDFALEKRKNFLLICSVILTLFSCLSGSKKAVFIAIITIPSLIILRSKNKKKVLFNIAGAGLLIIAIILCVQKVPILYKTVGKRINSMLLYFSGGAVDPSTFARIQLRARAFEIIRSSPILGIGLGAFKHVNDLNYYAHDNYLELASCLGIVGIILYYFMPVKAFIFSVIQRISGHKKEWNLPLIVLLCMLIMDVATVSYMQEILQVTMALTFALIRRNMIGIPVHVVKES